MTTRIDAEKLIIGDGSIITNGSVVIDKENITYAGEQEHAPKAEHSLTTPVLMPGLWECHGHLMGLKTFNFETIPFIPTQLAALRGVWDVQEALLSGITSIREVGGHGIYLNRAIQEGAIQGPRIYSSGSIISTTGGHADIHGLPLDILHYGSKNGQIKFHLTDGRDGCYTAVRTQLREGAEVIKYCASGGVLSEIDHPIHQQFSLDEQKAIVEEANRAEVAVAAHCHGAPGIKSALEAGVKTIEHGSWLDEDLADLMIEKDAILVPTRYIIERIMVGAEKGGVPDYAAAKLRALYDRHFDAMKIAIKKGVTIAMGTDMGISGPGGILRWGENAEELSYYVKAGLSPMDAITTATGNGPLTLGKRAPFAGLLKEGYQADLLLLNANPVDDITIMSNRKNIMHVVKSGNFV
ncbi:MAG: metal-dependent hydrolase family protein [Candidatus Kariarchaeaceae archaeon]|jgi:imidazolonepropionase-like amidohydrolase